MLESLVSCTNAIGPASGVHQAENYIEIVQPPRARADGHIAAEQRNIQTYFVIIVSPYLYLYYLQTSDRGCGEDRRDVSPAQQRAPRPHQPAPAHQPHPPPAQPQRQARQVRKVGEGPYWGLLFVLFAY